MSFFKRLSIRRYYMYKDEVIKRNVIASQTFIMVGAVIATVSLLANMLITKTNSYWGNIILLAYFVVSHFLGKVVLNDHPERSTWFLYAVQVPIMILGILMGTVFDKKTASVTFFLILICLPPFILDNPLRHLGYLIGSMCVYLAMGYMFKNPAVFNVDLVHAVGFFMGALFLDMFVLAERFDNLENYIISEKRAQHDEMSSLKNRYALRLDTASYVDKQVFAAIINIDYFKFFNDMFGHDFGEELVTYLGKVARKEFGEKKCYRFESDEILVLDEKSNESEFKKKLSRLKESFAEVTIRDKTFHPSCTAAYVYGTPVTDDDMNELIRHADVRLLEAMAGGKGTVVGYPYDRSQKRQTDILSEVAKTSDINTIDEITGVPNMQFFRIRADEMLGNILDLEKHPSVLYFNLGNFKLFNEENGFRKGDKLLRDIADILKEEFDNRVIARFSEDHFVVLCYESEVEDGFNRVVKKVRPLFGNIHMTIKAGAAVYTMGENVGITCDKAKLACDSIKHDSKKYLEFYSEALENKDKLQRYVISHIDEAVEKGYLRVYYQPIIDLSTGQVVELEALARWIDPIHGFLAPSDFIPPLEESKLIHKIDAFMAGQVCRDQVELKKMAGRDVPVSINLSRLDFMITNMVDSIKDIVTSNNVNVNNIHIEVTESALENDSDELRAKLNELKNFGFEIWLDDFGSGYSSLNSLQDFNFDVIKVDMKFMRTLETSPQTKIIVKSIIEMTKNLKLRTLMEGVETETQAKFIRDIGVDMSQGYLFSRPVPIDELKFDQKKIG